MSRSRVLAATLLLWPLFLQAKERPLYESLEALNAGSTTPPAQTSPPAAPSSAPPPLSDATADALRRAQPGDLVVIRDFAATAAPGPLDGLPLLPLQIKPAASQPQFLLSDQPEYFRTGDGISLQEQVAPGQVRLYVYHVPRLDAFKPLPRNSPKTVTAVIENLSDSPLHLDVTRAAFPDPNKDSFYVAKMAQQEFFGPSRGNYARVIQPGDWAPVDPRMDHLPESDDVLVHGVFEFTIDQPARVSVLQKNPQEDSRDALKRLSLLTLMQSGERGAGRGLYAVSSLDATAEAFDAAAGPRKFIVADGKRDRWITGQDGIQKTPVFDKGNYGVVYKIRVPYKLGAGQELALLMTSGYRIGNCGSVAAAVNVDGSGPILIPTAAKTFKGQPETVLIKKYEDSEGVIELTYSPPGTSCIPTPFLLIPYPLVAPMVAAPERSRP